MEDDGASRASSLHLGTPVRVEDAVAWTPLRMAPEHDNDLMTPRHQVMRPYRASARQPQQLPAVPSVMAASSGHMTITPLQKPPPALVATKQRGSVDWLSKKPPRPHSLFSRGKTTTAAATTATGTTTAAAASILSSLPSPAAASTPPLTPPPSSSPTAEASLRKWGKKLRSPGSPDEEGFAEDCYPVEAPTITGTSPTAAGSSILKRSSMKRKCDSSVVASSKRTRCPSVASSATIASLRPPPSVQGGMSVLDGAASVFNGYTPVRNRAEMIGPAGCFPPTSSQFRGPLDERTWEMEKEKWVNEFQEYMRKIDEVEL